MDTTDDLLATGWAAPAAHPTTAEAALGARIDELELERDRARALNAALHAALRRQRAAFEDRVAGQHAVILRLREDLARAVCAGPAAGAREPVADCAPEPECLDEGMRAATPRHAGWRAWFRRDDGSVWAP